MSDQIIVFDTAFLNKMCHYIEPLMVPREYPRPYFLLLEDLDFFLEARGNRSDYGSHHSAFTVSDELLINNSNSAKAKV